MQSHVQNHTCLDRPEYHLGPWEFSGMMGKLYIIYWWRRVPRIQFLYSSNSMRPDLWLLAKAPGTHPLLFVIGILKQLGKPLAGGGCEQTCACVDWFICPFIPSLITVYIYINRSIDRSIDRSINQSINQSIKHPSYHFQTPASSSVSPPETILSTG